MTWEEAGLISKHPMVNEVLREAASRNEQVPALQALKEKLERWYTNSPILSKP